MTRQKTLKATVRARMAATGETYTKARASILQTDGSETDATLLNATVRKVNQRSARIQFTGEDGEVTFRSADVWRLVPGHSIVAQVQKRWTHRGHGYASGRVESERIDVAALGLEPLPMDELGAIDLASCHDPCEPSDRYAALWQTLSSDPRPAVEFSAIAWQGRVAAESGDIQDCPITDAVELRDMGHADDARQLLMELLHDDLRCIDAHAHLGNWEFDRNVKLALQHYEVGIRIGALSLPADEPDLLVPWSAVFNRPYLRCLHGYGLCLWQLDRLAEAEAVFERMLRLNPVDQLGARMCLFDVQDGKSWADCADAE